MCACLYVCVSICVCVWVSVCACMRKSVYTLCVSVCICVWGCVLVWGYVCACECVREPQTDGRLVLPKTPAPIRQSGCVFECVRYLYVWPCVSECECVCVSVCMWVWVSIWVWMYVCRGVCMHVEVSDDKVSFYLYWLWCLSSKRVSVHPTITTHGNKIIHTSNIYIWTTKKKLFRD